MKHNFFGRVDSTKLFFSAEVFYTNIFAGNRILLSCWFKLLSVSMWLPTTWLDKHCGT